MKALRWCCQRTEQLYAASPALFSKPITRIMATSSQSYFNLDVVPTGDRSSESGHDERKFKRKKIMIVGLGNHGHPDTRHSVGMKTVDLLANKLGISWEKQTKLYGGFICQTILEKEDCKSKLVLFKPKALMNVNGSSVAKTAKILSIAPENIYLIHDELDKSLGKFHIKEGGSAGGHNGVLSCMSCLKSNEMFRLRIGISRPSSKLFVVPYVLSKFSTSELMAINTTLDKALDALLNHINNRNLSKVEVTETSCSNTKKHKDSVSEASIKQTEANLNESDSKEIKSSTTRLSTSCDTSKFATDENNKNTSTDTLQFQSSQEQKSLTKATREDSDMFPSDVGDLSFKSIKDIETETCKQSSKPDEENPER